MINRIRLFMLFEALSFIIAALIHSGVMVQGYEHVKARIAESVIAIVLLVGTALTFILPSHVRRIGTAAQGFALLATLVGVFTIAIGVGPRTLPDVIYHICIVVVLVLGLNATRSAWQQ